MLGQIEDGSVGHWLGDEVVRCSYGIHEEGYGIGQDSALSSCMDDCFGVIGWSRRGRLSTMKIAGSDMRSGSFSGIMHRFADTKTVHRRKSATSNFKRHSGDCCCRLAYQGTDNRWAVCRLSDFVLFA